MFELTSTWMPQAACMPVMAEGPATLSSMAAMALSASMGNAPPSR